MPYIDNENRAYMLNLLTEMHECPAESAGELQFMIAILIREFMANTEWRYQDMNNVMGALAGAQQEFYRRVVAPYEDECILRNGDIPGYAHSNEDKGRY